MRVLPLIAFIVVLSGCQSFKLPSLQMDSAESQVIESAVLWKAELDPVTWESVALRDLLADSSRFEESESFYEVRDEITAFGHKVTYIGVIGVDPFFGPNVTLKGDPEKVAAAVTEEYGIQFDEGYGSYAAELQEDVILYIVEHPTMGGATIVIGAYFGP